MSESTSNAGSFRFVSHEEVYQPRLTGECASCIGACCRNVVLPLSRREKRQLERGGTDLRQLSESELADNNATGGNYYEIRGACGYLDEATNACTIVDSPRRPAACFMLQAGSSNCQEIRAQNGLAPSSEPVMLGMPAVLASLQPPHPESA